MRLRDSKNLTSTELFARDYILKNRESIASMSIYKLARAANCSPATIVRLCRKMDTKGYSDFRIQIARETKLFVNNHIDILDSTAIKKSDTVDQIIQKITDISLQSIEETRILVDKSTLEKAAKEIMRASVVDFYGLGASNNVAFDAAYKFMRIGKNVSCFQLQDRQAVQAVNSNKDHVAILISYSGETKEILNIAKILSDNSVETVSITSSQKNSLVNLTNINLFVSSKETSFRSGAMASRTSTLYVIDLLYSVCVSLDYDSSMTSVKKTRIVSK